MAEKPRITLGSPPDPRNRALIDGLVEVEGYDIEYVSKYSPGEFHYRFVQGEYDVAEMSTATFLRTKESGKPFVALPVFFQRGPRQRNIFYAEGKLKDPRDLKGKKLGCFRYGATAVSWARGFLLDEYDIKTTDVDWFVSGREVFIGEEVPVKIERIEPPPPFGQEKALLAEMVSRGALGAALVPGDSGYLGLFGGGSVPGQMGRFPGVKPLFADTDEIIQWVKRSGIYPIIHVMALKEETAERYPDLPARLIAAFRAANALAPKYLSPEAAAGYAREREVLGYDPYAYVLGATEKKTMRALNRYQIEQGLMKKELPLESLFVRQAFS
ncbi:MAG TPA: ABC transporter substrate-binding protein [Candidatus Binatia bacterium]